jgi:hypothetical protein
LTTTSSDSSPDDPHTPSDTTGSTEAPAPTKADLAYDPSHPGADTLPGVPPHASKTRYSRGSPTTTHTTRRHPPAKATACRWLAALIWLVAIAVEVFWVSWLFGHPEVAHHTVWVVVSIVVSAVLSAGAWVIWQVANRLDPAVPEQPASFFFHYQVGAILCLIGFLPWAVVVWLDRRLTTARKTVATVAGVVVLIGIAATGITWTTPSPAQVDDQVAVAIAYTGRDRVYWTTGATVYHLCSEYPANTTIPALDGSPVQHGPVATAVAAGATRLSIYGYSECGLQEGYPAFAQLPNTVTNAPTSSPS